MVEFLNPRSQQRSTHQKTKKTLETGCQGETRQSELLHCYNRYTKELPELYKGKAIYVQDSERKAWSATKVVDQGNSHRSYTLEIETGVHL